MKRKSLQVAKRAQDCLSDGSRGDDLSAHTLHTQIFHFMTCCSGSVLTHKKIKNKKNQSIRNNNSEHACRDSVAQECDLPGHIFSGECSPPLISSERGGG